MDTKAEIRLGGLILLATAALSLILVLIVDSWPIIILSAIVVIAVATGGPVWTSRRQRRQFIERLERFDIDPEKGRVNETNLHRMYHSGEQAQKGTVTLICLSQRCLVDEAHAVFKKRPTRREINQMAMQQFEGREHPHR